MDKKLKAVLVMLMACILLTACSCAGVSESASAEKETQATETTVEETTAETTEAETGKAVKKNDKKDTKKETETTKASVSAEAAKSAEVTTIQAKENQSGSSQPGQAPQESTQKSEEKKPEEPQQPKETEHVHSWQTIYKTVHHDAVFKDVWVVDREAWTEDAVWEDHDICQNCGLDFTAAGFTGDDIADHGYAHIIAGEPDNFSLMYVCVQDEIYHEETGHWEKKETTPAWDEKVPSGEKCSSCGATR